MGNDLNDYEVMNIVGVRGCPADAEIEIKRICDWVSVKNGGEGVIRELYRKISHTKNWKMSEISEKNIEIGNAELYKKRSGYGYYTGSIWVKRNTR